MGQDILNIKKELDTSLGKRSYYSLKQLEEEGKNIAKLPFSIRILLENVIRNYDGFAITEDHIKTIMGWQPKPENKDIPYVPARVLMQDFTGVPAVVDIASIRSEVSRKGKKGEKVNPLVPVDLVIDHSVQVDFFGTEDAYRRNVEVEYQRNEERYQLLKWAQKSFDNFTVVPPGMGICHQVNLENLAKAVVDRDGLLFPDTLVGTDSHTPMVNGIGVVGWGVGGIEAEAAMLGQPIFMLMPEVIGLKLTGKLQEGITSTDMVLAITELLRKYGVVGKFVEVFGPGLDNLTVPDRATISNMSPEFGCTVTYFPIDDQTLDYMKRTFRSDEHIATVKQYCKENMLWRDNEDAINYTDVIELDLTSIKPAVSGPKRPQDKILTTDLKNKFKEILKETYGREYKEEEDRGPDRMEGEGGPAGGVSPENDRNKIHADVQVETAPALKTNGDNLRTVEVRIDDEEFLLHDGSVVIAAITSCTNTSNPSVMIGAGLVAKKAVEHGIDVKPWVKTSLAPGSKVVTEYLEKAELMPHLEALKFHVVGYGCTTCIGNSGQLPPHINQAVEEGELVVSSVLSGNRNFEARIHPQIKMNFLASPLLVVAYAIAGRVDIDIQNDPLAHDPNGEPVYLKDIWPSQKEIADTMLSVLDPEDFNKTYATIFDGDDQWQALKAPESKIYDWDDKSTYVKEAPFFQDIPEEVKEPKNITAARALLVLGDSITTDHISPAGAFSANSPAGKYLVERGVDRKDFNSYGSRRGNHEVMMRGTFANVRIKNQLVDKEGGYTVYHPTGEEMTVFEASEKYRKENIPLVVLGGSEYGSGSSRDWAAKGTILLGVKAVIAKSYERIHRSNLVGMGVLPLQFKEGEGAKELGLSGSESFTITGIEDGLTPGKELAVSAKKDDGSTVDFNVLTRLDSGIEVEYYKNGGILHYVVRRFIRDE